jgi:flagellar protein FliT
MDPQLLSYYEAIERASADMLAAARAGHWDEVVKLEGACVLLISQLKHEAQRQEDALLAAETRCAAQDRQAQRLAAAQEHEKDAARAKSRIMQRILVNDAEIRQLAEPWLQDLEDTLAGRRQLMH